MFKKKTLIFRQKGVIIYLLFEPILDGGRRGIRTLGTPFQAYGGLANRWFKPAHPSFLI